MPPVRVLVATYQCLVSTYELFGADYDSVQITEDLRNAGIAQLIAGPDGLPTSQRALILNDYAFWMMQIRSPWATGQAVDVLRLVARLAPNRSVAWLNLGDALRTKMNGVALSYGVFLGGDTSNRQNHAALGQEALISYQHYVALARRPQARVSAFVKAATSISPRQAADWSSLDAIENMAAYPKAAATVLALDDEPAAYLALAMDDGLLLPNPNKEQINTLLDEAVPNGPFDGLVNGGFNGTAASFLPYLAAVAPFNGTGNFPIPCGLIEKYPELIQATQETYGSTKDNFDPVVACADPKLKLPDSVSKLDNDLSGPSGIGNYCGTIKYGIIRQSAYYLEIVQYEPRALLPPFAALGDQFNPARQEQAAIQRLNIGASSLPLVAWGESDVSSYHQAQVIGDDFAKAQADLTTYYQSSFRLSHADAALAAFHAVWLIEGAWQWAGGGVPNVLAEALLSQKPLEQVQSEISTEKPIPASMLFLSINYPEALKLLLAQHPNLGVTTPIGKTVLMEAAKYNQLESVKLLLSAGADINAVSLSPDQIPNNAYDSGFPYACDGFYAITHGSRTALMYAAANANLDLIKLLIASGADKKLKDSAGKTALDYLEGRGPVAKNPVLNGNDFKIAETLLAP